jgi:hypothetical protein
VELIMPEITLTQGEADALIAIEKHRANDETHDYPGMGGSICLPLISGDKREDFLLDVSRGRIDLRKGTYQNRARQIIVLVRLDFGGQPHRNPDDVEVAALISAFTEKDLEPSGPIRYLRTRSQTSVIYGKRLRIS